MKTVIWFYPKTKNQKKQMCEMAIEKDLQESDSEGGDIGENLEDE